METGSAPKVIRGGGVVVKENYNQSAFLAEEPRGADASFDQEDKDLQIPSYDSLKSLYEARWLKEKEKFYAHLKKNFRVLSEQYRTGRQEIFHLVVTPFADKYVKAFRELFADPGYQAQVGDDEHSACGNKKFKKLYIVLPECVR